MSRTSIVDIIMDGSEEASTMKTPQQAKKRTRASVACNFCRIKRSKCDAATVGTPCSQCSKNNIRCELRQDGKRQRSSSRLQIDALTERVKMLESLLNMSKKSPGPVSPNPPSRVNPPAGAFIPPANTHDIALAALTYQSLEDNEPDLSFAERVLFNMEDCNTLEDFDTGSSANEGIFEWHLDGINKSTATVGPTCPTTVVVPTAKAADGAIPDGESTTVRRASFENEDLLTNLSTGASPSSPSSSIPESLVDHLLDMYFHHFQTLLQIVDERTFRASRNAQSPGVPAVRESLLLAMLAAGARFSPNPVLVKQYAAHPGESGFVRRSKALLESEIDQADIMTVQALLILGELETSAGNEMSGCMYSGLVSRLIFDLGLDPASSQGLNFSDSEVNVRHWILWYASVQDKYWAQSMNRPLIIKNTELQLSRMITKFSQQAAVEKTPSTENIIHESLLDLMELAREALDVLINFKFSLESYATLSRMNSKLDQWLRNQPQIVRNGPTSSSNTNHFAFVLLMQFHMTKIQLHQPFAFDRPRNPGHDGATAQLTMDRIAAHCQSLGASSAIKMAKLFATFRQKYDIRYLQCSGIQYAAIAARFLIKYIPLLQPDEVVEPEAHLRSLTRTLEDMAQTFKPAVKPLQEAKAALRYLENPTNVEGSGLYGDHSLSGRSYSSSHTRPALDNLVLPPSISFPTSGKLDINHINDNGKLLGHQSSNVFEEEEPEPGLPMTRSAKSSTFSLDSGGSATIRTSIDGLEELFPC